MAIEFFSDCRDSHESRGLKLDRKGIDDVTTESRLSRVAWIETGQSG